MNFNEFGHSCKCPERNCLYNGLDNIYAQLFLLSADKTDPDNSKDDDDNDDDENSNANRGTGTMFGAGPPSAQPSDIVKFPTVTVVEAAKNEHDDAVEVHI